MQRVAFVVSIVFLLGACQKATLIPDEVDEKKETRSKEGVADSVNVSTEFETQDWDEAINADFTFGGEPIAMLLKKGGIQ